MQLNTSPGRLPVSEAAVAPVNVVNAPLQNTICRWGFNTTTGNGQASSTVLMTVKPSNAATSLARVAGLAYWAGETAIDSGNDSAMACLLG